MIIIQFDHIICLLRQKFENESNHVKSFICFDSNDDMIWPLWFKIWFGVGYRLRRFDSVSNSTIKALLTEAYNLGSQQIQKKFEPKFCLRFLPLGLLRLCFKTFLNMAVPELFLLYWGQYQWSTIGFDLLKMDWFDLLKWIQPPLNGLIWFPNSGFNLLKWIWPPWMYLTSLNGFDLLKWIWPP